MSTSKIRRKYILDIISDKGKIPSSWNDYRWHLQHRITTVEEFERLTDIVFSPKHKKDIKQTLERFPLSITPYYLSLINTKRYNHDPVFKQAFPDIRERLVCKDDMQDPLSEDEDSPVPCLTHRYPDRVLLEVSSICSMYCRHCTRKRRVGDVDKIPSKKELKRAITYIRKTKQIRDVLLSGGDPFLLSDDYLDWILTEIRKIEHIEIIRIGTRVPVVLPFRITRELVKMLKKHQPLWINTHFNHPCEITATAQKYLARLADAGFPLGNQTVLLAGVNDCPRIIKKLVHKLVQNRVRPYYLYQCDLSEGLSHLRTPVSKGIEIIESLIGHTSGFSVPTYVIDAPHGGGKIPIMPNYLISWSTNKVILRNYEGIITTYKEPDSYEPIFCDRKCDECKLTLNLDEAKEDKAVGIKKLISDHDKTVSLTPLSNERIKRRKAKKE